MASARLRASLLVGAVGLVPACADESGDVPSDSTSVDSGDSAEDSIVPPEPGDTGCEEPNVGGPPVPDLAVADHYVDCGAVFRQPGTVWDEARLAAFGTHGCGEVEEQGAVFLYDIWTWELLYSAEGDDETTGLGDHVALTPRDAPGGAHLLAAAWNNEGAGPSGVQVVDIDTTTQVGEVTAPNEWWGEMQLVGDALVVASFETVGITRGTLLVFNGGWTDGMTVDDATAVHNSLGYDDRLGADLYSVGDVTGDGQPDAVVYAASSLYVLPWDDLLVDEGVGNARSIGGAWSGPTAVANVGDPTGDGVDDLAVGRRPSSVSWNGSVSIVDTVNFVEVATIIDSREHEHDQSQEMGALVGLVEDGPELVMDVVARRDPPTYASEVWLLEVPRCGTVELTEAARPILVEYGTYTPITQTAWEGALMLQYWDTPAQASFERVFEFSERN